MIWVGANGHIWHHVNMKKKGIVLMIRFISTIAVTAFLVLMMTIGCTQSDDELYKQEIYAEENAYQTATQEYPSPTPEPRILPTPSPAPELEILPTPTPSREHEDVPPLVEYITIRGIDYCTSLTMLYLSQFGLSDEELHPLRYMTELRILDLTFGPHVNQDDPDDDGNYYQLTDISPLASLTNLEVLVIDNHNISDITALNNLVNLVDLSLSENNISDITPLRGLKNLRYLSLCVNQLSDLSPLSGLLALERLHLSHNQITDLTPLSRLTNLVTLNLRNNEISDISPVSELTNLERLILPDNQIADIAALSGMTSLTWLDLGENRITNWSPVRHVPSVRGRP